MSVKIHWQEGLFLQAHHLQRMQKSVEDDLASERRLGWPYPFGVIEARLSRDELENKRIRFDKLRAIMPSGLEVNYPATAELPSLDIAQAFSKGAGTFTVLLGVPLWQNSRANTVPLTPGADTRVKLLYRVGEIECFDENTGENPKPIQVRKINSRLLFEQDDTSDMEVLPLLRVVRATGQNLGMPKEDPEFVPPCLLLNGSPTLRDMMHDLVNQVEATRKELVVQITSGGFSIDSMRGLQFVQMLRLRTLNRFSGRLPALIQAPALTPFAMYLELRGLLGELAALHPDRDEFETAPYNHDNLFLSFRELSERIRKLLRGDVPSSYREISFKDVNGLLTATFSGDDLTVPNAYFLAIKTKLDPLALAAYVQTPDNPTTPDKFKLMPHGQAMRAIRGIVLKYERQPPLELPAATNLHYFRIDRAASMRMWQEIQKEKVAVVRWTGNELDWSDASFTFYMTVPSRTTKP